MSGNFIARTTVQHVTRDEYLDPVMRERIKEFDEQIKKRLDDTNFVYPEAGELYIDAVEDDDEAAHGDGLTANKRTRIPRTSLKVLRKVLTSKRSKSLTRAVG